MPQKDSQAEGLLCSAVCPSQGCQGHLQPTSEYAKTQDIFENRSSGVKGNLSEVLPTFLTIMSSIMIISILGINKVNKTMKNMLTEQRFYLRGPRC